MHGEHGELPLYFEAAGVIISLVIVGQVLELRAREQTSGAIRKLLDLSPKVARRIDAAGEEQDVDLHLVQPGDLLRVRPGERIPTDDSVVSGASHIDEALVTGEAAPVAKGPGDKLIGGTLNQHGSLVMRAERVGEDTFLAQVVRLVVAAHTSRAQVQQLAERVSAYVVPAVVLIACVSAALWGIYGPDPKLIHALSNSVSVLIIACPCALGLATPMSLMVGLGRGAEAGVLVKNAEALERLDKVDTLVVDKTGTLTEGKPSVVSVHAERDANHVLALAMALESQSEHPRDHAASAARVAQELEISEVFSAMLPEDKLTLVKRLQGEGRVVAFAGDGVNDAPALMAADVGIAMDSGSDIALESAQVALHHGDLSRLEKARHLSRATMRNIRQNLAFAFGYNLLGVPVAAGALYPLFGLVLHPMLASLAMSLSSVSVIANASGCAA